MFDPKAGEPIDLGVGASGIVLRHVFEPEDVNAVQAALLAKRPLLLRGEPGVGKSQLALAAAIVMRRAFYPMVVDARSEARDLKWHEDVVARLADAQLIGGMGNSSEAKALRAGIDLINYVAPGPLWWGFNWGDALRQAGISNSPVPKLLEGCGSANGVVVLIDEIDKAESELPNGLLEALGSREFTPNGRAEPVQASNWPLIVVTTNEERRLPDAFLRRCVVHDMRMPSDEEGFQKRMIERGRAYFGPKDANKVSIEAWEKKVLPILVEAAEQTWEDRLSCKEKRLSPLPGQAEYLDLLRAVFADDGNADDTPTDRLNRLSRYFLKKHPEIG